MAQADVKGTGNVAHDVENGTTKRKTAVPQMKKLESATAMLTTTVVTPA